MKLRPKHPKLLFFWALPLIAVLAHDLLYSAKIGYGFNLSEIGFLLQNYTPWHDPIIAVSDSPLWIGLLKIIFNMKAAILAGLVFLAAYLWLNRSGRSYAAPKQQHPRR